MRSSWMIFGLMIVSLLGSLLLSMTLHVYWQFALLVIVLCLSLGAAYVVSVRIAFGLHYWIALLFFAALTVSTSFHLGLGTPPQALGLLELLFVLFGLIASLSLVRERTRTEDTLVSVREQARRLALLDRTAHEMAK